MLQITRNVHIIGVDKTNIRKNKIDFGKSYYKSNIKCKTTPSKPVTQPKHHDTTYLLTTPIAACYIFLVILYVDHDEVLNYFSFNVKPYCNK